jgi:predicted ATP-dependent endonuclease of OLD family
VRIELEPNSTIFVGANNSGKTSAAQILDTFLAPNRKDRFSIHDFSANCWKIFDEIGNENTANATVLPSIVMDLWFQVDETDLHKVVSLLPSLNWNDAPIGVRLEFAPKNQSELRANFLEAKNKASKFLKLKEDGKPDYHPWPSSLTEYLKKRLNDEYKIWHYVLDYEHFDANYKQIDGYTPQELGGASDSGAAILRSLIKIDFLTAQRHLSDDLKGQAENLSRRLSRFYERNLEKYDEDFKAVAALAKSEEELNKHLESVFGPTLKSLNELGYPGFADPHLVIKSAFDPESILTKNASVHYSLRDPGKAAAEEAPLILPDKYNGLGFKNLIYMVVEILDFHQQWVEEQEKRPPLHLIIIEEPEAHLHAQLQKVFINKIREILPADASGFITQMILTTHSPHVIYESSFKPIRYFRRMAKGHHSEILNLSKFYENEVSTREFLYRYMKQTHCDLFFADAAILVEGNVERLLLPMMIEKDVKELKSCYLSILELGGAFAHVFRKLVHFLGLTTLVITDLDSVSAPQKNVLQGEGNISSEDEVDLNDDQTPSGNGKKKACMAHIHDAVTSNQTLINWVPKIENIAGLLAVSEGDKCPLPSSEEQAIVRVAYQTLETTTWNGVSKKFAGRTLEEAFAFQNLEWCQGDKQKALGLQISGREDCGKDSQAC